MKQLNLRYFYSSLLTILVFITGCTTASTAAGGTAPTFKQQVTDIWVNYLLPIFSLSFLGLTGENSIMAFMRLIIIILVFTLLFEATRLIRFPRNTGIVIAGVIAIMSGLFIPGTILIAIGSSYGFLVALVLLATPILGSFYLFSIMPTAPVVWRWARIILLCIVLYLLINIKTHAMNLVAATI
jgi:hypothetical protein